MLQRPLTLRMGVVPCCVGVAGLALAHCGSGVGDEGSARASSEAILGGSQVDAPDSPVLSLVGPEGGCSAVLVAPTLVVTARHCVANTTPGGFSCAASGDVINTGNGAGQIGTDNSPDTLSFFAAARAAAGSAPDAVGAKIISTLSPTACRDDLAFVVLDRTIPGLVPAPIRITRQTSVGEAVSVWGYGLTAQVQPTALRMAAGVQIDGVGPDLAPASTQTAPLRAVRVGEVTCLGDSGGPIVSAATGAVIAIVSLGGQAANAPYCMPNQLAESTGPRLAAYHDWIVSVFQAAGASPITDDRSADAATDSTAPGESSSPIDDSGAPDDAPAPDDALTANEPVAADEPVPADDASAPDSAPAVDAAPDAPPEYKATGGSCATAVGSHRRSSGLDMMTIALAWTAVAVGRRRR